MPKYTSAYSSLVGRLEEVSLLVERATSLERDDPLKHSAEIAACCRGAIVLLSGHLEGYIKDLGELVLERIFDRKVSRDLLARRFFYEISKDRFDDIKNINDPGTIAERIFDFLDQDGELWEAHGPFPFPIPSDKFVKGFASPSVGKISSFFGRFGYIDYKRDMQSTLRGDYVVHKTMIDNIVGTRNSIAHGDYGETRPPTDVKEMLVFAKVFCRTTDQLFANWAKKSVCTIR